MSVEANKSLAIEDLLGLPDSSEETSEVDIPGLGRVVVRAFSKADHTRMIRKATVKGEIDQERLEVLALSVGMGISEEQAEALRRKRWGVVQVILNKIWEISGMNAIAQVTQVALDNAERAFPS